MEYTAERRISMALFAECYDCGAKQKVADSGEGSMTRCLECGALIGVDKKSAAFVATKKRTKKKRKAAPDATARLTDNDRKDAIRAGQSGVRLMLVALFVNLATYLLLAFAFLNSLSVGHTPVVLPYFIAPVLGLVSSALLTATMFRWRPTAAAIERGQVVQVGLILGPILFGIELLRVCGVEFGILSWLATYGQLVYFTLLVVYIERVCVLADRSDLQDLNHRVLSCGVGVIGIALLQQFVALIGVFILAPLMAILSVVMIILRAVWCVEYFRLLMLASALKR